MVSDMLSSTQLSTTRAWWAAITLACLVGSLLMAGPGWAQGVAKDLPGDLPDWVHEVGARQTPEADRVCPANEYGAVADTSTTSTRGIQQAIDACAEAGGGIVTFAPGNYLTGAIFVKSNVHLRVGENVTIYGSHDMDEYPERPTRVAGIEMTWPTGLINVDGQENVRISGGGTIDGRGEKWWDMYWDMRRNVYEPQGLRWAVDYDAKRVRLMLIEESSDVTVENLDLQRSGFWTVHLLYSDHVTVEGITISENQGPSTDGVDIDSSTNILVQNNSIDNDDDNIVLKAGRDADGLRVDRPTEYVFIRNNLAKRGAGLLSFGSETSGDIRHVVAFDNRALGTSRAARFKSAKTRGGVVEDILIRNMELVEVDEPFRFTLNWNPSYSYTSIPDSMDEEDIPEHWKTMLEPVEPPERGLPEFRDITIEDVKAVGAERIFTATGLPERKLRNVVWRDITIVGEEAGFIEHAQNWTMENITFLTPDGEAVRIDNSEGVDAPPVGVQ